MVKAIETLNSGEFLALKDFLDRQVRQYNTPSFIAPDPISIPHRFSLKQDIEISGLFAAVLAWGQRKTILNKLDELLRRMDNAPYDFVLHHTDVDLKSLLGFKHRTFNDTDLLYFISFLNAHYKKYPTLETAFMPPDSIDADYLPLEKSISDSASGPCFAGKEGLSLESALNYFRPYFFSLSDYPTRTVKHISSPRQGSTCKRLNMFLRWMVRKDQCGVDFGIWTHIRPSMLICPCDVHVDRVGRSLGLITRKQTDWRTALELTANLRKFDPADPVKYDFALFGMGVLNQTAKL